MLTALRLLTELAHSPDWPSHWMTIEEIAAELARRGLWSRPPLLGYRGRARLDFLACLLSQGGPVGQTWAQLDRRFKHSALLSEEDRARVADADEARLAEFNEDLERILLGEARQAA